MNSNDKCATNWKLDSDRQEYAIEALAMSVQFALQKAMNDSHITQKELAHRLQVTPARVSQILAKDATNLTLKTIGRISDALGEEFEVLSLRDINQLRAKEKKEDCNRFCKLFSASNPKKDKPWIEVDQSAANNQPVEIQKYVAAGQ